MSKLVREMKIQHYGALLEGFTSLPTRARCTAWETVIDTDGVSPEWMTFSSRVPPETI